MYTDRQQDLINAVLERPHKTIEECFYNNNVQDMLFLLSLDPNLNTDAPDLLKGKVVSFIKDDIYGVLFTAVHLNRFQMANAVFKASLNQISMKVLKDLCTNTRCRIERSHTDQTALKFLESLTDFGIECEGETPEHLATLSIINAKNPAHAARNYHRFVDWHTKKQKFITAGKSLCETKGLTFENPFTSSLELQERRLKKRRP